MSWLSHPVSAIGATLLGLGIVIAVAQVAWGAGYQFFRFFLFFLVAPLTFAALVTAVVIDVGSHMRRAVPGVRRWRNTERVWHLWSRLGYFTRPPVRPLRVAEYNELARLSPSAFEQAVATMLADIGFRKVHRIGGPGDLGVDIAAVHPDDGGRVVVQCKRYAPGSNIGSKEIQTFIGMTKLHHQAAHGLYVTTSAFTRHAQALAAAHREITLIDGVALAELFAKSKGRTVREGPRPEKALAKGGWTRQQLVDDWRHDQIARGSADLRLPSPEGQPCQCRSDDRFWVGYRDRELRPHLICPSCLRFATPDEVEEALSRGDVNYAADRPRRGA
jgi:hypothetical protein